MQIHRIKAMALATLMALPCLSTTGLQAIPQTVSGIFNGPNGQSLPLEEWFRDASHWLKEADLPGRWSASGSDGSVLEHSSPGAVFGVNASSATVTKTAGGEIQQIVVRYPTAKDSRGLVSRLTTAVALFQSNKSWEKTATGMLNKGSDLSVTLLRDAKSGEVSVVIARTVR